MKQPIALACIAALALAAAPALADDVRSEVVEYADLNLNRAEGADALVRRIENAAGNVCGDRAGPRPLDEHRLARDCAESTERQAVHDVAHPMVTARYYGYAPQVTVEPAYGDPYYAPRKY